MPLSQFTSAKLEANVQIAGRGPGPGIVVEGPLTDTPLAKYTPPFAVHVTIIQSASKDDHDPDHALRAVGITTVEAGANKWELTIDPNGVAFDRARDARGVGVAVFARTEGYTSEVLTWCDHLFDMDGSKTKEEADAKAAVQVPA
jgi:hypothetical protein